MSSRNYPIEDVKKGKDSGEWPYGKAENLVTMPVLLVTIILIWISFESEISLNLGPADGPPRASIMLL